MRIARLMTGILLACTLALAGCASTSSRHGAARRATTSGPLYYVSLGDSLSQGIQPNAFGVSTTTSGGYPNRIYAVLAARQAAWRLVKLGCSGETTSTMIHGGICTYPARSQLAQAELFLRDHRGYIGLITIDIGANDPNSCILGSDSVHTIMSCVAGSIKRTKADLRTIMSGLRAAVGPHVTILAMNYYVPELAGWLDGMTGKLIAVLTERLVAGYNKLLAGIYRQYGAGIANVFGAFHSADFTDKVQVPGIGVVPRNVAAICEWTWACARWPQGPNEHANELGYSVIALAFLLADPQLSS